MRHSRARRALERSEPSRLRAVSAAVLAAAAMAVAGPLAAVAVGAGPTPPPGSGGGGIGIPTATITLPATTTAAVTVTTPATTTTTTTSPYSAPPPVISPGPAGNPLSSRGMWIWLLSSSDGGNLDDLIAEAKTYGLGTLIIKSGDGSSTWSQFSPTLVATLHAAGLHVCAWQFVYGIHPILEARVGAQAVRDGADCLMIDAEGQYQGKYVQAQTYITKLRQLVGANYPIALAGLPYVDYHPGFPYSVFLGPGGAQYNAPQMYWDDIGVSPAAVFAHTYEFNELYQRPIAPLGQLYGDPPLGQIRAFRALARYYPSVGVNWWDWQAAGTSDFRAAAQPVGPIPGFVADTTVASLGENAVGDVVVWAQEHLVAAGERIAIDGDFGPDTLAAVKSFQTAKGLPPTGLIDPETWTLLLRYAPVKVKWVSRHDQLTATVARDGVRLVPVPASANRPERGNELAGDPGEGWPPAAKRH